MRYFEFFCFGGVFLKYVLGRCSFGGGGGGLFLIYDCFWDCVQRLLEEIPDCVVVSVSHRFESIDLQDS